MEHKTLSDSEGDWECGQDENDAMCSTHHEPSKLWRKECSKIRTCVWIEEDFPKPWHQVSSSSSRGKSHTIERKQWEADDTLLGSLDKALELIVLLNNYFSFFFFHLPVIKVQVMYCN